MTVLIKTHSTFILSLKFQKIQLLFIWSNIHCCTYAGIHVLSEFLTLPQGIGELFEKIKEESKASGQLNSDPGLFFTNLYVTPVLKNISLYLEKGQMLAVAGSTGSGKVGRHEIGLAATLAAKFCLLSWAVPQTPTLSPTELPADDDPGGAGAHAGNNPTQRPHLLLATDLLDHAWHHQGQHPVWPHLRRVPLHVRYQSLPAGGGRTVELLSFFKFVQSCVNITYTDVITFHYFRLTN